MVYYLNFVLLLLTSLLQWQKYKSIINTQLSQRRKHTMLTLAFGCSYILRAIYDTLQTTEIGAKAIENLRKNSAVGW